MSSAYSIASTEIVFSQWLAQFHQFLSLLSDSPRVSDPIRSKNLRRQCLLLAAQARQFLTKKFSKYAEFQAAVREALEDLRAAAQALRNRLSNRMIQTPVNGSLAHRLGKRYEALLLAARNSKLSIATTPSFKPINWYRSAFHVSCGALAAVLYETILSRSQALTVLGVVGSVMLTLEFTRRLSARWNDILVDKLFGLISRPGERHRTVAATYYLVALFIIALLFPQHSTALACLAIGFGDPFANIIGKRFGRTKIFREKSWVGTLTFVAVTAVAGFIHLAIVIPEMTIFTRILACLAVGVAGAVTELFSHTIDDNLSIPIVCAAVASLILGV